MGLNKLKKIFIQQEESNELDQFAKYTQEDEYEEYEDNSHIEREQDLELSEINTVDDICKAYGSIDMEKSIYKVEEIKKVLPNSLPSAAKKESVLGMMKVSDITVEEVLEDAKIRKSMLNEVKDDFSKETINIIEESQREIQEHDKRINELKESINKRTLNQEKQEKIIEDELKKIDEISNFIK